MLDIAEGAVAHEYDDITGVHSGGEMIDDLVNIGYGQGGAAPAADSFGQSFGGKRRIGARPFGARYSGYDQVIGRSEGLHVAAFKGRSGIGGAGRFEDDPETGFRVGLAQAQEGLFDGGRVVGEVVDEGDATDLTDDLLAPFDSLEGAQPLAELLRGKADV